MIAVEAASKSLKTPTAQSINDFVDKILDKQNGSDQFLILILPLEKSESIKKVLSKN